MALLIRPLQRGDLPALERCVAEMQEAERAIDPRLRPGAEMAKPYSEQLMARCAAQSGIILVADDDGTVVGFVAVQARVPYEDLDDPPETHALVSDLVVLASHRRTGIGQSLLDAAEQHARRAHAGELRIHVLAGNLGARALYHAAGFNPYAEVLTKRLAPGS